MKKTYPVIQNKYVVDKEAGSCETIGATVFAHQYNLISTITEKIGNSCRDIILKEMPHSGTLDYRQLYPVIAVIGEENRLKGLPVIVFEGSLQEMYKIIKQPQITEIELEVEDNGHEVDMEGRGGMDEGDTCWMPKIELKITKSTPQGDVIIIQK